MAIIKALSNKSTIKNILKQVMSQEKTTEQNITGLHCSPDTAFEEMRITKMIFDKCDGVQYHHIMQAFKPFEVNAEIAHNIGVELAEMITPGYQIIVATHTNKNHICNHIVINSVHRETGKKYHSSKKSLWDIKRESNRICERENLSTIDFEKKAKDRITTSEHRIKKRGGECWKDDLRDAINAIKIKVTSLTEMQTILKEKYNVEMKIQNKNISFLHPDKESYCGAKKLGNDYTKEILERGLEHGSKKE